MLNYFRINDPYRLIIIFLLLLAIRLPIMLNDNALTLPELNYMLVGEMLNDGSTLYEGIWDNIAPLSASAYMIIDFLFGRSQLAYQIIALVLVAFQCLVFNRLLLRNKAYNENTYIPGLVYGLLMSFFFDFLTLTPVLMGTTFLLLALNNIFNHIEFRAKQDEMILNIGLYLGIAYLFYLPNIIFGVAALLVFAVFTGTVARRYILMLFGFSLPMLLAACYFLLKGRLAIFIYNFLDPLLNYEVEQYMSFQEILILFSVPIGLLILALVRVNQRARFTNYQARLTQVMFVWIVFSIGFVFLSGVFAPNTFMVFVPSGAFFLSHYLLLIKKRWMAEIAFQVLFASVILFNLGTFFDFFYSAKLLHYDDYLVKKVDKWTGKRILVLDYDMAPYVNAYPATPFLNWQLSEELFRNPEYYDNLTILQKGFSGDFPEVIIDKHGVMSPVFDRLPALESKYDKKAGNIYYLKKG